VDAGCGTGRHTEALVAKRFEVTGVDASPDMIAVARRRVPDARLEVADIRRWEPEETFDGALCRGVLNDFDEDLERQAALDGLAGLLRPGGLLVLGVRDLERTRERYAHEPVVTRKAEGVYFRSETHFDGDLMRIHETISSADDHAVYDFTMRPWTRTEVEERARAAGFARIEQRLEGDRIVALLTTAS
jgi:trans-aconitate methyltransferase